MRIQHNIMAMNSYRNLGINNGALSKNLEKLSSGYRINRAGDDAAGLAISEKMRAQISGLDQAQKNAQSGINLVKTAEGALTEVHDMLNRMVTLATQSANGTYINNDRSKIQAEIDALVEEIDRIADNSNFNGQKLLNGELGGAAKVTTGEYTPSTDPAVKASFKVDLTSIISSGIASTKKVTIGGTTFATGTASTSTAAAAWTAIKNSIGTGKDATIDSVAYTVTAGADNTLIFTQKVAADYDTDTKTATIAAAIKNDTTAIAAAKITGMVDGVTDSGDAKGAVTKLDLTGRKGEEVLGSTITIDGKTYEFVTDADKVASTENVAVVVNKTDEADALATALAAAITGDAGANVDTANTAVDGTTDTIVNVYNTDATEDSVALEATQVGKGLTLQIGADKAETISVSVNSMKADALLIKGLSIGSVSDANAAIKTINDAIEAVSVQRGDLGAIQNRLEHTINNLGVMEENIQDAEANIRDTDIADEMMAYTKNNILIQSAQAMLAQANQVPQGVLQLLQ